MLTEWYLRRQFEQLAPAHRGSVSRSHSLAQLAKLRQLIIPSARFLYAGMPRVRQFFAMQDQTLTTKHHILQLAGSLAAPAPIEMLRALVAAAEENGQPLREIEVDQLSELGVGGKLDRSWYVLGDEACMQQEAIELGVTVQMLVEQFENDGKYTLFLAQRHPKRLLGIFACEYDIRPDIAEAVAALRQAGVETVLLTGTQTRIAQGIAKRAGISLIHSQLDGQDKSQVVQALAKQQPAMAVLCRPGDELPAALPVIIGKAGGAEGVSVPNLAALAPLVMAAKQARHKTQKLLFWSKV